jgi:hypothetical protein
MSKRGSIERLKEKGAFAHVDPSQLIAKQVGQEARPSEANQVPVGWLRAKGYVCGTESPFQHLSRIFSSAEVSAVIHGKLGDGCQGMQVQGVKH